MNVRAGQARSGSPRLPGIPLLLAHARAIAESISHAGANPVATVMGITLMGLGLALPGMTYTLIDNQRQLAEQWGAHPQITLFLRAGTSAANGREVRAELLMEPAIKAVEFIDRASAFGEFVAAAGFTGVSEALENPLPHVLVVVPQTVAWRADGASQLVERLERRSEIDTVIVDLEWLARLEAITRVVERAVWILATLLALVVLTVVSSTMRTLIQQQRPEIEVAKLVGATDAYVRRPFLYGGALHGFAAGITATLLIALAFAALNAPLARLAESYMTTFAIHTLSAPETLALIGISTVLGWCGAWLAVNLYLQVNDVGDR